MYWNISSQPRTAAHTHTTRRSHCRQTYQTLTHTALLCTCNIPLGTSAPIQCTPNVHLHQVVHLQVCATFKKRSVPCRECTAMLPRRPPPARPRRGRLRGPPPLLPPRRHFRRGGGIRQKEGGFVSVLTGTVSLRRTTSSRWCKSLIWRRWYTSLICAAQDVLPERR